MTVSMITLENDTVSRTKGMPSLIRKRCAPTSSVRSGVLQDAWDRYVLPVAITEAHLGSTREEQLRWLKEFWDAAVQLRESGVDVRAVTVWSLLGSYDWNRLVTTVGDFYEPGAFDVRGRRPRRTAIAGLMRDLAAGRSRRDDPLLALPGWWRRPDRTIRPHMQGRSSSPPPASSGLDMEDRACRPLVILGATGTLGDAFARACDVRGIAYHIFRGGTSTSTTPVRSITRLRNISRGPSSMPQATFAVRVDEAEHDIDRCMRTNAVAPGVLAAACSRHDVRLVCFSSDLVFDGSHETLQRRYVESDAVCPLSVYGRSKAEMEARVLDVLPEALVIRTAAFFGPWDSSNFVTRTIAALAANQRVTAALDIVISPTYVIDLVNATLDILIDGESGIWHLTSGTPIAWAVFAQRLADLIRVPADLINAVPAHTLGSIARRPRYSALSSERGAIMPALEDALMRYLHDTSLEALRSDRRRPATAA
jgi:dTDP-4-dehydrorhamnose reductase